MNLRFRLPAVFVVVILLIAGPAYGQKFFQMQVYSKPVEVLSQDVFDARFGKNPHIPRNEEAIIALAERLYTPLKKKVSPAVAADIQNWCGEEDVGILFAALRNPEISDATRRAVNNIIAAAIPHLFESKVSASGHFKIFYTTNDADPLHNVTAADINRLAVFLDSYWEVYAKSREPQHRIVNGKKRIDVWVYYIDEETLGQTCSDWDHIELNSALCVRNRCESRSTAAHELFHRVQYAYGYESGTPNMGWMVEGTAVWSQKFTNPGLRDYMFWMNEGLRRPDTALFTSRDYDAAHFWVYLQELYKWAIEDVWIHYEANGKKAKAAVTGVLKEELSMNFDQYVARWSMANYIKGLSNADEYFMDYDEDDVIKISCGWEYGPLREVPVTVRALRRKSSRSFSRSVKPYGADYLIFTPFRTSEGVVEVNFQGSGSFMLSAIGIKNDMLKTIIHPYNPKKYTYPALIDVKGVDKFVLVVTGTKMGGSYNLTVSDVFSDE